MYRNTPQRAARVALAAAVCALAGYLAWSMIAGAAARGQEEAAEEARETRGPDWIDDYELGRQIARRTGRPMFVVFRCER